MPLYDDDDSPPHKGSADITMKFLQAQIAQKRVQIQQGMQRTSVAPVVDLSARNRAPINMRRIQPVRALPITECAPPSFLPKGAVDDSVNLFGEYIVKNEYQPAVPNEYITCKRKAEEREARERHAREVAERLSRDHKEEARKRQKGAAIAPPQALLEPPSPPKESNPPSNSMPPPAFLPSFGKATSKGLGVAANIMSKFGYKHGGGLGRDEQGMSTALSVEKLGKNAGLIINESQGNNPSQQCAPMGVAPINMTQAMKSSTKVLMLTNMVGPDEVDDELEPEIREEMAKYGQVASVVIHKMDGVSDDVAVRIFVEFTNIAQAIKAFVVMNGRFFGGRSMACESLRVEQVDANILDGEYRQLMEQQFERFVAELPITVSRASPGQVEVDISYKDYPRKKVLLHFVLSIFLPYIAKRAENLLEDSTAIKFVSKSAAILETIHILHFLNFLRVGGYSSLTESFLKLRNWNMHPPVIGTVNYESQNRELLWHTFRDALLLLWPALAVISAKWKNRRNHREEQANVVALSCGRCGQSAVVPMRASGCGHIACYWCVMSRMPAESARCATCGEETLHVTPVRGHAFL
ncbi:G-patch domain protein [Trichostrongylus colubriformis]|uniref:G-patch domain protein n=1 Tax=Trichostrongylus colubriformis TaxID=6319 RepID=A0AAN8IWF2_TRICO